MSVSEKFALHIQERETELRPVFTEEGITYVYIKANNLIILAVTKRNSNVANILYYLYRLVQVFRTILVSLLRKVSETTLLLCVNLR